MYAYQRTDTLSSSHFKGQILEYRFVAVSGTLQRVKQTNKQAWTL